MTEAVHDVVMTIDERSVDLKVAKSTLYKLVQEGKLPGQKVARHWRFHREAIDAWLKQSSDRPAARGDRGSGSFEQ